MAPYSYFLFCSYLHRRSRVEEYIRDTWVLQKNPIYPLKIREESALGKSKKRKINLGKSTDEDIDSCRTSIIGLFKEISIDMGAIRELVSRLPTGLGAPSISCHSYVAQTHYEWFLVDQQD